MANKSFIVEYIIKARDRFTVAANKASKATDNLRKKVALAAKQFKNFSAKARRAGAILTASVSAPIAFLAFKLKNAARDAGETEAKFNTVFKSINTGANEVAANLSRNYGLASDKSKELLANTGDLLTGFGFSQESALRLSEQVNTLAVDLAAFTNFSGGAEGASAALTKALLGERESVKSLGISILEADVKKKVSLLLSQGRTFASLRQAKAEATLAIAIEQSKNAIGDFSRTQKELANQERITKAGIRDLAVSFGKLLLPVALKIQKVIQKVVKFIAELSPGAKKAILIISGIAAVLGPLLLVLGSLVLIMPAVAAGFAILSGAMAPILGTVAVLAAAGFLIMNNWEEVGTFFKGFSEGIESTFGPTLDHLITKFREAAVIIAKLFAPDSEAAKNMEKFASTGELIGVIIGGALDVIVRGLAGMGALLGQLIGAVVTMDFSQFDADSIIAEFTGRRETPVAPPPTRVDVGVNVGLDQGLQQTAPAEINSDNVRRADIGVATGG